jgi:hypothetical protein
VVLVWLPGRRDFRVRSNYRVPSRFSWLWLESDGLGTGPKGVLPGGRDWLFPLQCVGEIQSLSVLGLGGCFSALARAATLWGLSLGEHTSVVDWAGATSCFDTQCCFCGSRRGIVLTVAASRSPPIVLTILEVFGVIAFLLCT